MSRRRIDARSRDTSRCSRSGNRAYNLTAILDPFAMIDRHVIDSLTTLDFLVGTRLLDAGTGAGLPGLVLAIVRPDVRCTAARPRAQEDPVSAPMPR